MISVVRARAFKYVPMWCHLGCSCYFVLQGASGATRPLNGFFLLVDFVHDDVFSSREAAFGGVDAAI